MASVALYSDDGGLSGAVVLAELGSHSPSAALRGWRRGSRSVTWLDLDGAGAPIHWCPTEVGLKPRSLCRDGDGEELVGDGVYFLLRRSDGQPMQRVMATSVVAWLHLVGFWARPFFIASDVRRGRWRRRSEVVGRAHGLWMVAALGLVVARE